VLVITDDVDGEVEGADCRIDRAGTGTVQMQGSPVILNVKSDALPVGSVT
jgi:hypothetical protein